MFHHKTNCIQVIHGRIPRTTTKFLGLTPVVSETEPDMLARVLFASKLETWQKKLHATLIRGEACNNYDTVMQNLSLTAKHTVYVGMYICALNSVVTYLYLFCVVYVLQIFVGVLALA